MNTIVLSFLVLSVLIVSVACSDGVCNEGEEKLEVGNICTCANDKWTCTPFPKDPKCLPGVTSYEKECNTCVCASNGNALCTIMAC